MLKLDGQKDCIHHQVPAPLGAPPPSLAAVAKAVQQWSVSLALPPPDCCLLSSRSAVTERRQPVVAIAHAQQLHWALMQVL
jgi:hypothetical protein